MRALNIFIILFVILVICGCSKSTPAEPPTVDFYGGNHVVTATGTIEIDPDTMAINIVQNRDTAFHYDVTSLLAGSCPGGCFRWQIGDVTGNLFIIELTLENPTAIQVHDVRLVLTFLDGKIVENPDGYTDVFHHFEWSPFMAFAKTSPDRAFPVGPGGMDYRDMELRWPAGAGPFVTYFIEVSLGGNCHEPYMIHGQNQLGQLTPTGGNATVHVEVSDHQGDISDVIVDTTPITSSYTFLEFVAGEVWEKEISNTSGAAIGSYNCLIRASSPGETAAIYDYIELSVTEATLPHWNSFGGDSKNTGRSYETGPQTDNLLWFNDHTITGDYHTIGAPVIDSAGDVYYHVTPHPTDGRFYKVSGADGSVIWSHDPDDDESLLSKEIYSVPAINEESGYVYYACMDGLWCVEMASGDYVAHYPMADANEGSSPTVGAGRVYIGYPDDSMTAFSPDLSTVKYQYNSGDGFSCAAAVDSAGNAFFPALGPDRKLIGLDIDGVELFTPKNMSSEALRLVSAAIEDDGTFFYQTGAYKLYAFSSSGTIKWSFFSSVPNTYYSSPVLGHGSNVYIFREKMLIAVDKETGDEDWSHVMDTNCITPLVDASETIYFMDYSGVIHAFNTTTKTDTWSYATGRPLYGVPVYRYPAAGALGPDGLLVFMGNAGVWAFKDV